METTVAKPSEGINFPSMNNIDSELPGDELSSRELVKPIDGLLDRLTGACVVFLRALFEVGRALPCIRRISLRVLLIRVLYSRMRSSPTTFTIRE